MGPTPMSGPGRWRGAVPRIGPAPACVAPRHIPARFFRQRLRHEIEPGRAPRLAAQQPRQRHPAAGPQAEAIERLIGIVGAGRQMPAAKADQRRRACSDRLSPDRGRARRGAWRQEFGDRAATYSAAVLRRGFAAALGLDLADGVDHGVEGQQRRGVARLVVAHRFEHRDIGPLCRRPAARRSP